MRTKIVKYNKHSSTIDTLERQLRYVIANASGDVVGMHVVEHGYNGDIIFRLDFAGGHKTREQDVMVLAWLGSETVEDTVNSTLDGIAACGKIERFLNVIALLKSSRFMAAMVVESSSGHSDGAVEQQQGQAPVQDASANAKPKRGRKPKSVSEN